MSFDGFLAPSLSCRLVESPGKHDDDAAESDNDEPKKKRSRKRKRKRKVMGPLIPLNPQTDDALYRAQAH